jgi:hypothetical protein
MPWTVHVDGRLRVSYARMFGVITFDELVAAQRQLAAEPPFDPTFPLLMDMRRVKDLRLTWPELKAVIARSPLGISTRRAIVARTLTVLGTARVYELVREAQTHTESARVFRTLAEAEWWLGVKSLNPRMFH